MRPQVGEIYIVHHPLGSISTIRTPFIIISETDCKLLLSKQLTHVAVYYEDTKGRQYWNTCSFFNVFMKKVGDTKLERLLYGFKD